LRLEANAADLFVKGVTLNVEHRFEWAPLQVSEIVWVGHDQGPELGAFACELLRRIRCLVGLIGLFLCCFAFGGCTQDEAHQLVDLSDCFSVALLLGFSLDFTILSFLRLVGQGICPRVDTPHGFREWFRRAALQGQRAFNSLPQLPNTDFR